MSLKDILLLRRDRALEMVAVLNEAIPKSHVELIVQPGVLPQYAHWRIPLSEVVAINTVDYGTVQRDEIYVGALRPGYDGELSVSSSSGANSFAVRYHGSNRSEITLELAVREGYSISKHPIAVEDRSIATDN